ncbi:hypothetical protein P5673_025930 [Acropora cervicornis]|uniref:Uncharacterized protein n=1 Tax=Acropora cervicornis TaxID=6130 RepID=A0AAD9Q1T7_ACRCE|nr:hypothetical protein P5673_025930 [Acropora cervicornis]
MFLGVLGCSRKKCCGNKERVRRPNNSCIDEASSPSTGVLRAASKASRTSTPDSSVFFIRDLLALTAASTLPLDLG